MKEIYIHVLEKKWKTGNMTSFSPLNFSLAATSILIILAEKMTRGERKRERIIIQNETNNHLFSGQKQTFFFSGIWRTQQESALAKGDFFLTEEF